MSTITRMSVIGALVAFLAVVGMNAVSASSPVAEQTTLVNTGTACVLTETYSQAGSGTPLYSLKLIDIYGGFAPPPPYALTSTSSGWTTQSLSYVDNYGILTARAVFARGSTTATVSGALTVSNGVCMDY